MPTTIAAAVPTSLLEWMRPAHCIDLILEDIGKNSNVATVLEQGKIIFIYNQGWVINYKK